MGKLCIDLFTTLDGVAQAPGGPDEDRDGGFPFLAPDLVAEIMALRLRLLEPPVTGSSGAVQLRYAPTGADPETGDVGDVDG